MIASVTRRLTFDAGHRVPGHTGACRNLHGHTYTVEITCRGEVGWDGMVVDFGILKTVLVEEIHDRWDHAFLVWANDRDALAALSVDPTWKTAILPHPPTAENLAAEVAHLITHRLRAEHVLLERVVVHETPNCCATWEP